jgi:hypothetical protein
VTFAFPDLAHCAGLNRAEHISSAREAATAQQPRDIEIMLVAGMVLAYLGQHTDVVFDGAIKESILPTAPAIM